VPNQFTNLTHCKRGHPLSGGNLYTSENTKNNGLRVCRICRNMHMKLYRDRNIVKVRLKENRITKERVERYWQMILDAYGRACYCCGEVREDFLTLHHINGDGGEHRRRRSGAKLWLLDVIREGFPKDKYDIACMNCNYAQRWGRICPHELERRAAQAVAAD
jgi:hypothetical protein